MLRLFSRLNPAPRPRKTGRGATAPLPLRGNWRHGPAWGVLLGWIAGLVTLLVTANHPLGARLQYDTLDFWFRLRDPALPRAAAILAVDDATVQRWKGRDFDAKDTARLLRLLKSNGVRAVALAFPDLATHPLNPTDRAVLVAALRETGIGHLPMRFRDPNSLRLTRGGNVKPLTVGAPGDVLRLPPAIAEFLALRLDRPSEPMLRSAAGVGFLNFSLDPDGRVREIPLLLPNAGRFYPALPLSVLLGSHRGVSRRAVRFTNYERRAVDAAHAELLLVSGREIPAHAAYLLLNFPTGSNASYAQAAGVANAPRKMA
jgi:CHASE2 domain-containing sensor protein